MQFILNMRASPTSRVDLTILSGEVMDESEYMDEAISTNHKILLLMAWTYKSLLAFNFGNFEMAAKLYQNMARLARVYRDSYGAPPFHFYGAMIFYERFRTTRQVKHLKTARKHILSLKRFEAVGSPNVSAYLVFLQAEKLSLRSRDVTALFGAYAKAIDAMKAEKIVHLEALANERLSIILSSLGRHDLSNTCFECSLRLCRDQWGAIAKYDWLLVQRSLRFDPSYNTKMTKPLDEIHI